MEFQLEGMLSRLLFQLRLTLSDPGKGSPVRSFPLRQLDHLLLVRKEIRNIAPPLRNGFAIIGGTLFCELRAVD
jgi:hypothetical protein